MALHVGALLVVAPGVGPAAADGPPQAQIEAPTPLEDIERIASGFAHRCALRGDGTVWCWGYGIFGSLGTGSNAASITPAQVDLPATAVDVVSGSRHVCALLSTGDVWCWGPNTSRELGFVGSASAVPVLVPGVSDVAEIWAGQSSTCVRKTNDAVMCWGGNANGNLTQPSSPSILPTTMTGIAGVADIAFTVHATCALLADDSVRCWGQDTDGSLGDGPGNSGAVGSADAVEPIGLTNVRSLEGGVAHMCAVRNGQFATSTRCWGDNWFGQSVPSVDAETIMTPTTVPGLNNASHVEAESNSTCVRTGSSDAVCWGETTGITGEAVPATTDVTVVVDGGVSSVSLSTAGLCTVSAAGRAFCRGDNLLGAQAGVPGAMISSGTVMAYEPAFTPADRQRLMDTHPSGDTIDGLHQRTGRIPANRTVRLGVSGRAGVPAGGSTVVVRVRVDGATRAGQLSVFSCSAPQSRGTTVSFGRKQVAVATTAVALTKGRLCLRADRRVHVVVDLDGRQAQDDELRGVAPSRVWDTRPKGKTTDGQLQRTGLTKKGTFRAVPVLGRGSVASDGVSAVMMSVTAGNGRGAGSYVVTGCTSPSPTVVSGHYERRGATTTFVVAPVSPQGTVCVRTSSRTHVMVDVVATIGVGGAFQSHAPARVVDTRPGGVTDWGGFQGTGPIEVDGQYYLTLALPTMGSQVSMAATPSRAVVLTVTASGATQPGRIDVWPCSGPLDGRETVLVRPGRTTSGSVVVSPSPEGFVCFSSTVSTNVTIDIAGRFHR